MIEVTITRDSVCLADDVDAPHEHKFGMPDSTNFFELAVSVARSSYLPMPSDAWGWTIKVEDAVVAVRKGFLRQKVEVLRGTPTSIVFREKVDLFALYARPGSPWRDMPAKG